MALLEVKDFHYSYGNIHVIKGINLHVEEGEIVTIIGANGAGKTTTLQTISGLTDKHGIQCGVWFNGKMIVKTSPESPDKIVVSREKGRSFKDWINR